MKQFFTIVLILIGITVNAQENETSIGLRSGGVSGLSIKFIDDNLSALEIILGYQNDGFRFVGLIEKCKPVAIHRIANFFFVSGIGGHAGYTRYDDYRTIRIDGVEYYSYDRKVSPIIGADMMLGFEYHFESLPINISLDYKPYFELFGQQTFRTDFWDLGFSIRYAINK